MVGVRGWDRDGFRISGLQAGKSLGMAAGGGRTRVRACFLPLDCALENRAMAPLEHVDFTRTK